MALLDLSTPAKPILPLPPLNMVLGGQQDAVLASLNFPARYRWVLCQQHVVKVECRST